MFDWIKIKWKKITGQYRPVFEDPDRETILQGTDTGKEFRNLKPGDYFAIVGKENYPKVKINPTAYYDFSFQVFHRSPGLSWRVVEYTEEEVREIFRKKRPDLSEAEIQTLITQRRIIANDID